jgi:hypothetical protein
MQTDFSISRSTRKCAVTGKVFEPGESYISVVVGDEEHLERKDIATSAWTKPPANTIGWWKCKMPQAAARKLRPAPTVILLDALSDILTRPDKQCLAYLLAVLLCRRRVLCDDNHTEPYGAKDGKPQLWQLNHPTDGRQWLVPVAVPPPNLVEALQAELNALLFTEE